MREIININRNDAVRVILDDLSKDKVVVLSGGFGSGKTTLL
jgi:tRNA A37 threonylcarbamoyladenosine biosynthesis protein TsaE